MKKIAAEAHRQGMVVWAHSAIFPTTPAQVLDARADVISHTCYMAYQVAGVPASYQAKVPIDSKAMIGGDNPVMARPVRADEATGHDPRPDASGSMRRTANGSPRTPRDAPP